MTTVKKVRLFKEKKFLNTKVTFTRNKNGRVILLLNFDQKQPIGFADVYCENVKVLCAVWDLMHYAFNLAQKPIRGTNSDITTSAHIAQNTCYRLAGFSVQKLNRNTNKKSFKK